MLSIRILIGLIDTDAPTPLDAIRAWVNLKLRDNIIVIGDEARLATPRLVSDRPEGF